MPKPTLSTVRQSLKVARGLISGAAVSLEHVISRGDAHADDAVAMQVSLEQQAGFIIGELEHAVARIKAAVATSAALNAAPVVEAGRLAA